MIKWFHKLLNPHCLHCLDETICSSCETLKQQLTIANQEKEKLLNNLLNPINQAGHPMEKMEPPEPLAPKHIPWSVKRQMLEEEDRAKARVMREQFQREKELKQDLSKVNKDIKDLESELGVLFVEPLDLEKENAG